MSGRLTFFVILGAILLIVAAWGEREHKFDSLNQIWLEFCIGNSLDDVELPAVTVIRIDDGYEPIVIGEKLRDSQNIRLSRLDYATIFAFLAKFAPRAVAFTPEPEFDDSLPLNRTDIAPLRDAAMKLPRLLIGTTVIDDQTNVEKEGAQEPVYPSIQTEGDLSHLPVFTRTVLSPDPQILANGIPVFKSIRSTSPSSADGSLHIPLVARQGDQVVPSLVLAAVAEQANVALEKIRLRVNGSRSRIEVGETYTIPVSEDGSFEIPPYTGFEGQTILHAQPDTGGAIREVDRYCNLTVDELAYTGTEDDEVAKRLLSHLQPRFESLRENLILIGFDRTADRRITTKTGEILSETGLLARAIATIQSGRYLHWWPQWWRWLGVAITVLIAMMLFHLPRRRFLSTFLIAGLAFFAAQVLIFSSTLAWTPPFTFFALFGLIFFTGLILPPTRKKAPHSESRTSETTASTSPGMS